MNKPSSYAIPSLGVIRERVDNDLVRSVNALLTSTPEKTLEDYQAMRLNLLQEAGCVDEQGRPKPPVTLEKRVPAGMTSPIDFYVDKNHKSY